MADIAIAPRRAKTEIREASAWDQLKHNRNWLGFWFMVPALAFLIFFLAYPLGLGIWLSFTDTRIGRIGQYVGIENYEWLWDDSIFWLSVFNTLLYTFVASAIKFGIGLYLALLLNENMPFKAMLRALVLIPIIAVVMTCSVLFTFTDFQLIWAMTRGGPVNATHLMATLSYQRAIIAGQLGEGAAISSAMIPFLLAAIMVSWFGLQRRKWQQGENND